MLSAAEEEAKANFEEEEEGYRYEKGGWTEGMDSRQKIEVNMASSYESEEGLHRKPEPM